jgi:hypothetical protein
MKILLQSAGGVFLGLVTALVASGLVLGSIVLALTEGGVRLALSPVSTSISFISDALPTIASTQLPAETLEPGRPTFTPTLIPMPTETSTATLPPPPSDCPPPEDWVPIILAPGDTLRQLAGMYSTSQETLAEANCLITSRLISGSILYVPRPEPTAVPITCGPPAGWVFYTVQPGDTLYRLSLTFGVSISDLQLANCMGDNTSIYVGQRIYAPLIPTLIPSPTPTVTVPAPTEPIPSPEPPTEVPTATDPPPPTATQTLPPTPSPAPTETTVPTDAPPSNTPPEISPVPGMTIEEDTTAGPIVFSVSDQETPPEELQVDGRSSNPALVPQGNIFMGGSGSERTLSLSPAENQSGSTTITITVTDASGGQASTAFELVVTPVNDAPTAQDDIANTVQDTPVSIQLLANDMDVDGDLLQIDSIGSPANGSLQVQGESVLYIPALGYTGMDQFFYTITDGNLVSLPATVTITINPPG